MIAWNKGLTKDTDERVAKYARTKLGHIVTDATREKISESKIGRRFLNWGGKFPDETRKKISESQKGKIISLKTRKKISLAQEGRTAWNKGKKSGNHGNGFKKGMIPWNEGLTKDMDERVRKISEAQKGNTNPRVGEKHWNWKGGITRLQERIRKTFKYRQWRSDVFTRDDFTCQGCGRRGIMLNAHHIVPFSDIIELNDVRTIDQAINCEELWNINNGITLCEECHGVNKKAQSLESFE